MKLCYKCKKENDRPNIHGWCRACHAKYMRENRKTYKELTPEQKKKDNARSYVNVYLRRGKIVRLPCIKCGDVNSEMHHEDYDKPLDIMWLCRSCHLEHHKNVFHGK